MDPDAIEAVARVTSELEIENRQNQPPQVPQPFPPYDDVPPPAPQLHSQGVVATEVTNLFVQATDQLDVGQIIKDDFFTLFEAVGAIEIMDPKMDTGYLKPGETMEDDYDIRRSLLPQEVLGIIDQLLCLEMAWHMGHPLSQTVFTSLYIDRLINAKSPRIEDIGFGDQTDSSITNPLTLQVLRAYCMGLIKTCWHVNNRVKSEHFYEEEDFVTYTYHRNLLDHVEDSSLLELLNRAQHALSTANLEFPEITSALQNRLKFRAAFLNTVSKSDERSFPDLRSLWEELLSLLPGIKAAHELANSVPEAFSVKLQRKLASTVPPRPVVIVPFETAYAHLQRLCTDGKAVTDVFNYHDSHSLMTFVIFFQQRKPQPSVYIRTLLQHYLFGDMVILGKLSVRQLIDDDLATVVLPDDQLLDPINDEVEVPHDPRFNMAIQMEIFRSHAAQSYLDILRTLCQNRCRIRRTLSHTIAEWDNLQLDAEEIDQELRPFTNEEPILDPSISNAPLFSFSLSSWAYFYKLRQMEWIVQMGFELEVYQPDELAGMYWYLQHITQMRVRHIERIRGFTLRSYTSSKNSKRNSKKSSRESKDDPFTRSLSYLNFSMLEATATSGLADALSALYVVLTRLNLISLTPLPYSTRLIRHELRMKPFLRLALPEFIPYETFDSAVTQARESTADILLFISAAASRARKDFELLLKVDPATARCLGSEEPWKDNVRSILRSSIALGIASATVAKEVNASRKTSGTSLQVEIPKAEKAYHMWWIVPKVTTATAGVKS